MACDLRIAARSARLKPASPGSAKPGTNATKEDIRAFCFGRIARFKIPRHVRFVETYPMTVSGKVQKFVMREIMTKELKADTAPITKADAGG
jgi:acyl-CoA synthetase (AMP-forming)/AMP-acid ligase II